MQSIGVFPSQYVTGGVYIKEYIILLQIVFKSNDTLVWLRIFIIHV